MAEAELFVSILLLLQVASGGGKIGYACRRAGAAAEAALRG
jgi:hypothetical protein